MDESCRPITHLRGIPGILFRALESTTAMGHRPSHLRHPLCAPSVLVMVVESSLFGSNPHQCQLHSRSVTSSPKLDSLSSVSDFITTLPVDLHPARPSRTVATSRCRLGPVSLRYLLRVSRFHIRQTTQSSLNFVTTPVIVTAQMIWSAVPWLQRWITKMAIPQMI